MRIRHPLSASAASPPPTLAPPFLNPVCDLPAFACPQREESAQLTDQVRGDVVKEMLPLVDNFELARTQVGGAGTCGLGGACGVIHTGTMELLLLVDAFAPART